MSACHIPCEIEYPYRSREGPAAEGDNLLESRLLLEVFPSILVRAD